MPASKFIAAFILILLSFITTSTHAEQWQDIVELPKKQTNSQSLQNEQGWNNIVNSEQAILQTDGSTTPASDNGQGKINVIFVQGAEAVSIFDNNTESAQKNEAANIYQQNIRDIFKQQNVEFILKPTKKEFVKAVLKADILYVNAHHGTVDYNGMQWLSVTPSDDNDQRSPGGASIVTSGNVKNALRGGKSPKLIVFGACGSIATPGVSHEGLFSTAFGIDKNSKNKLFIGWEGYIKGSSVDRIFRDIFGDWVTVNGDSKRKTLGDAYYAFNWAGEYYKKGILVGDPSIQYQGNKDSNTTNSTETCDDFHRYSWLGDNGRKIYKFNTDNTYKYANSSSGSQAGTGKWTLQNKTLHLDPDTMHSATCKSTTTAKFSGDCSKLVGQRIAGEGCIAAGKRFPWEAIRN